MREPNTLSQLIFRPLSGMFHLPQYIRSSDRQKTLYKCVVSTTVCERNIRNSNMLVQHFVCNADWAWQNVNKSLHRTALCHVNFPFVNVAHLLNIFNMRFLCVFRWYWRWLGDGDKCFMHQPRPHQPHSGFWWHFRLSGVQRRDMHNSVYLFNV